MPTERHPYREVILLAVGVGGRDIQVQKLELDFPSGPGSYDPLASGRRRVGLRVLRARDDAHAAGEVAATSCNKVISKNISWS